MMKCSALSMVHGVQDTQAKEKTELGRRLSQVAAGVTLVSKRKKKGKGRREKEQREERKGKKERKETGDNPEKRNRWHSRTKGACYFCGSRFWCWIKMWLEIAWSSSLGNPARVYKWINWSRPWWTRGSGKAPLMTMWHLERKPLSRTLGEAENGERTWDTFIGPWYISSNGLVSSMKPRNSWSGSVSRMMGFP